MTLTCSQPLRAARLASGLAFAAAVEACGGGGDDADSAPQPPAGSGTVVSAASPMDAACDYVGLASAGTTFLPLLTSAAANPDNRTNIVALRVEPATAGAARRSMAREHALSRPSAAQQRRWRQAEQSATVRAMEQRLPGSARRVGARADAAP
jgi:hypothetical protein